MLACVVVFCTTYALILPTKHSRGTSFAIGDDELTINSAGHDLPDIGSKGTVGLGTVLTGKRKKYHEK